MDTNGNTKELIKALCSRLPYGVIVKDRNGVHKLTAGNTEFTDLLYNDECNIKPYFFPLSSMSEEQKYEFYLRFIVNDCDFDYFRKFYLNNVKWHKLLTSLDDIEAIIDWFHKNHIDYRGFIPMGLAIDAIGLNIY